MKNYQIIKYNSAIDKLESLEKAIDESYKINVEFFGEEAKDLLYYFFYTREEFDEFEGEKSEWWLVGRGGEGKVRIFGENVFGNQNITPKKDQKNFYETLTHETNHSFLEKLFPRDFYGPTWLSEGIAGYAAKQYDRFIQNIFEYADNVDLKQLHTSKGWKKSPNYTFAFHFVKYLIDTSGKEKILSIFKYPEIKTYDGLLTVFNDIFKQNLEETKDKWLDEVRKNLNAE